MADDGRGKPRAVRDDPARQGFFLVDLPADAPEPARNLKQTFTEIQTAIANGLKDAPELRPLLPDLRKAAEAGFDGSADAPPDLTRAAAEAAAVQEKVRQIFARVHKPAESGGTQTAGADRQPGTKLNAGAFTVSIPDVAANPSADPRDLLFLVVADGVPSDQMALKGEIEDVLATLWSIFPEDGSVQDPNKNKLQRRFQQYQFKLLSLAKVGLEGQPAQPAVASQALSTLQAEVMAREGARVKNGYMKRLGCWAAVFALVATLVYVPLRWDPAATDVLHRYRNLLVLWCGCMVGTWISFGARRVILVFTDLGRLEADMVEPGIRLIFTGLMTMAIGFIFICQMVNVSIGALQTEMLLNSGSRALLIGMFCGLSEQALPGTLTKRAAQLLNEIGGK